MKKKKDAKFWIAVALVLCLISSVGASIAQTAGGKIQYHDVTLVGDSGHELDALLLIPENATPDSPAPAIVCSHGWYNNREMQDLNYVEYARRGFVVMSISMYGHGDSEAIANGTWWDDENNANGLYDAVKYLTRLNVVDPTRIGITGHSNGAQACREAVFQDDDQLIAAVLLVCNDAIYTKENTAIAGTGIRRRYNPYNDTYYNMFGDRDAAIVACKYDEFMHGVMKEDGNGYYSPVEYIDHATAQSFLHFGKDPTGLEKRSSYTYYTESVDGTDAIRAIFDPGITHPWAHFSKGVVENSVEFFDKALNAPVKLAPGDQLWQVKAAFNGLGLVGFMMFAIFLAIALSETKYFADVKGKGPVTALPVPTGKGKTWFYGGSIACVIFSLIWYSFTYTFCNNNRPAFLPQFATFYIGLWTLMCGLFMLLVLVVTYKCYSKQNGLDLAERGVTISGARLWKTILLSLIVVVASYAIVFVSDWLFLTDYRLWCFATLRAFSPNKLSIILRYLPFWLVYYIVLSVTTNGFNFTKLGKDGWGSTILQMFFVFIGPEIYIFAQLIPFFTTGYMLCEISPIGASITAIWMYPIVLILPLAVFVCSKIYRATKNPYIGGIIMALLACTMSVTNTLTLG